MSFKFIETVLGTELIKLVFLLTIGAFALYLRDKVKERFREMKSFITTVKEGANVLASEEFKALPAQLETLRHYAQGIDNRLKNVEHALGPNGGKSILDGVNALKDTLSGIEKTINSIKAKDREIVDQMGLLMWRSDEEGRCIWASKGLQELTGYSFEEGFKNFLWENLYFPEDVPEIRRQWEEAIELAQMDRPRNSPRVFEPEIIFSKKTRYRHKLTGKEIPIFIKTTWLPDHTYIGVVTPLEKESSLLQTT